MLEYLCRAIMGWLDIVIIIAVSIPAIICFRRGFVKTVLPLAGIGLAIILAGHFYGSLADRLSPWLDSATQCNILAFAIIFVLVVVVALVLASLLRGFLCLVFMGWVDNLGGAALGLAIGGIVPAILLMLAIRFYPSGAEATIRDSSLATFLVGRFTSVLALLPEELDGVRQFFG